jgi:hypothetical protein
MRQAPLTGRHARIRKEQGWQIVLDDSRLALQVAMEPSFLYDLAAVAPTRNLLGYWLWLRAAKAARDAINTSCLLDIRRIEE